MYKKYIQLADNASATHLKIELYYNIGGMNYFTYKTEARGYYLSVSPVSRTRADYGVTMESYTAFTGIKECVKTVSRKSAKAEAEAEAIAAARESVLIDFVCRANGLEVLAGE